MKTTIRLALVIAIIASFFAPFLTVFGQNLPEFPGKILEQFIGKDYHVDFEMSKAFKDKDDVFILVRIIKASDPLLGFVFRDQNPNMTMEKLRRTDHAVVKQGKGASPLIIEYIDKEGKVIETSLLRHFYFNRPRPATPAPTPIFTI